MQEQPPIETNKTPQQLYNQVFDQIIDFARDLPKKVIFLSPDEHLSIIAGENYATLSFTTTGLNISKTDTPEGAYPNTFNFSFNPDSITLSYTEALPRREQSIEVRIADYQNTRDLREELTRFTDRLNTLFEYFDIDTKIKVPS